MRGRIFRNAWRMSGLVTALVLTPAMAWLVAAQSPQLIVDLLTAPQKHWNTTVVVRGHVKSVTPNPPGTNRGTFIFRDSSDADISVVTSELPSVGKEYTVTAIVRQETPDAAVPVLHEVSRAVGLVTAPSPSAPVPTTKTPAAAPRPAAPAVAQAPVAAPPVVVPAAPPPVAPTPAATTWMGFSTTQLYGLALVIAVISVGLIAAFRPRRAAPPAVELEPRVIVQAPHVMPPLPTSLPPASAPSFAGDAATRYVAPRPAPAAAATTLFVDLGADLLVTEGPERGKTFPLTKPRITIGRPGARQNEVSINDESVSREHAKIVFNPAERTFNLINESTTNPARVNGTAIESALLQNNDVIQLGATSLKFVRRATGPSA